MWVSADIGQYGVLWGYLATTSLSKKHMGKSCRAPCVRIGALGRSRAARGSVASGREVGAVVMSTKRGRVGVGGRVTLERAEKKW